MPYVKKNIRKLSSPCNSLLKRGIRKNEQLLLKKVTHSPSYDLLYRNDLNEVLVKAVPDIS